MTLFSKFQKDPIWLRKVLCFGFTLLFVHKCFVCVYVCVPSCEPGTHGGRREYPSLELELQMVVDDHGLAGNQTWVLSKANKCFMF